MHFLTKYSMNINPVLYSYKKETLTGESMLRDASSCSFFFFFFKSSMQKEMKLVEDELEVETEFQVYLNYTYSIVLVSM